MEYKLNKIARDWCVHRKIIPKYLYVIPNNKVLFMEHIFQNINK
jgi:hypothetical protein